MAEIDELSIKIKADGKQATSAIDDSIKGLEKMDNALSKVGKNNGLTQATNKIKSFSAGLKDKFKESDPEMFQAFSQMGSFMKKSFKNIPSNLGFDKVFAPSKEFQDLTASLGRYKDAQQSMRQEMSGLINQGKSQALKGDSEGYKATSKAIDELKGKLTDLDNVIKKVNADMKSFPDKGTMLKFKPFNIFRKPNSDVEGFFKGEQSGEEAEGDGGSKGGIGSLLGMLGKGGLKAINVGLGLVTGAFKKLGNVVSDLFKPLSRTWKMLRLMFVRTVLHSIVTLTQQGFGNLIKYSDTFNESVSLLWNSIRQLSNAFAAMASPIVNKFSDNINDLIQQIIDGVNAINQFISALLGFDTWTKATVLTDNYRDSLDGATGSAKALKRQLQGFDELNNITSPSSGGGGGKNNTTDAKFMFTEEAIGENWKNLSDKIKETWNSIDPDFTWLGESIGKKITDALDSIDWTNIQRIAGKIGSSIATFINGAVSPESFGALGRTLGNGIQTAIEFCYQFVEKLDFANIGSSIASFFNNAISTIDWKKLGKTINDAIEGLLDATIVFVQETDWVQVGEAIIDLIASIDILDWVGKLEVLAVTLAEALFEAISGAVQSTFSNIGDMFGDAGYDGISAFFQAISDNIGDSTSFLTGVFDFWMEDVREAFHIGDKEGGLMSTGAELATDLLGGFKDGIDKFFQKIADLLRPTEEDKTSIKQSIGLAFPKLPDLLTEVMPKSGVVNYAAIIGTSFISGIKNPNGVSLSDAVGTVFKTAWENVKKNFTLENITSHANDLRKKFLNGFYTADGHDGLSKTLGTIFGDARDNVKKNFTVENITNHANNLRKNFLNGFYTADGHDGVAKTTGNIFSDAYNNMKKGFSIDSVKSYFNNVVAGIKSPFTTMASFMKTTFTDAWTKVQEVFSKKGKVFEGIKEGIADAFKRIVDSLIDGINNVIAVPFNAIKNALTIIRGSKIAGAFHFSKLPTIDVPVIPHVQLKAKGDYDLEDGWFRANHGEIMGTFDNGTSVVANNTHIIQGISEGVNRGMQGANREMINLLMVQNGILQGILEKETGISTSDIFNAVMSENKSYYNMTGANAFVL